MSAPSAIVRTTVRQLTGRSRMIGFGLLSLVPAALLLAASRAREGAGLDTDLGGLLVTPFFALVVPLITLILASSALGDERRDKTLSFVVLRPIGPLQLVLAKTLATFLVSMGYALVGAAALAVTYVALGGRLDVLPAMLAGAALVCALYSSIFVLLGSVFARATLVGLAYVLFVENVLVVELPRLSSGSPWRVGLAATIDLMPSTFPVRSILGAIGDLEPSAPLALFATAVTASIAVALCTALLARTDSV